MGIKLNVLSKPIVLISLLSSLVLLGVLALFDALSIDGIGEIGDGAVNETLLALALLIPTAFIVGILVDESLSARAEEERLERWETVRRLAYGDLARALLRSGRILEEAAGAVDSGRAKARGFELAYEHRATRGLEGRLRISAQDFFSAQYPSLETSLNSNSTNEDLGLRVRELHALAGWDVLANNALQQVKEEIWQVVARWSPIMVQVPVEARRLDAYSTIVLHVKDVADLFFSDRDLKTINNLPSGEDVGQEWALLKTKFDEERLSLREGFRKGIYIQKPGSELPT